MLVLPVYQYMALHLGLSSRTQGLGGIGGCTGPRPQGQGYRQLRSEEHEGGRI